MREPQYTEGMKALENFKEGMKSLFTVPKNAVVKAEKKAKKKRDRSASLRKPIPSDKD